MRYYYYDAYGGNFGDQLGLEIARRIYGGHLSALNLERYVYPRLQLRPGMFGLGSVLEFARSGDVVWGTGIKYPDRALQGDCSSMDIRAVRGPLTRDCLMAKSDVHCPKLFGDPGMLTARLFPEFEPNPVCPIGIIPHYLDRPVTESMTEAMNPDQGWRKVVEFIIGCELVISSSLHGLIVAESFGIPARWWHSPELPSFQTEGNFKFNDYYASTDRSLDDYSPSITAAIKAGGKESMTNFDLKGFLGSFPHDIPVDTGTDPLLNGLDDLYASTWGWAKWARHELRKKSNR